MCANTRDLASFQQFKLALGSLVGVPLQLSHEALPLNSSKLSGPKKEQRALAFTLLNGLAQIRYRVMVSLPPMTELEVAPFDMALARLLSIKWTRQAQVEENADLEKDAQLLEESVIRGRPFQRAYAAVLAERQRRQTLASRK